MYKNIIRPLLFQFNPETIHNITIGSFKILPHIPLLPKWLKHHYAFHSPALEREVFGLKFKNQIGLAAGLDKNAEAMQVFEYFGFGFVEIGTVTPKSQPGNEKPRIFRLPQDEAVINRMGFNNQGALNAAKNLKNSQLNIIVGGNIGKNKNTPIDTAENDYTASLDILYDFVDYFVVNVSSPNTPNLRALQDKEPLARILKALKLKIAEKSIKKPLLLKIAPDLSLGQLDDVIDIIVELNIDGLVATNTTIRRFYDSYSQQYIDAIGAGGLSGKSLKPFSNEIIKHIHKQTNGKVPIIGVGDLMQPDYVLDKLDCGASLVQLYTGFIYEGPQLVKRSLQAIDLKLKK